MKCVRYFEPAPDGGAVTIRRTIAEAIEEAKKVASRYGHVYANDDDALADFMAVHWADIEELEP